MESLIITQEMAETLSCITLIKEIVKLAETKDFTALELKPKEEDEEEIGELTDTEKAIFALFNLKMKERESISLSFIHTRSDYDSNQLSIVKKQIRILQELRWQLVEDRLNLKNCLFAIRAGYKIVNKGFGVRRNDVLL